jgi:hypothetical protein
MNQYEITIALMLAAQLFTVFLLRGAVKSGDAWEAAWVRDTKELLNIKKDKQ